MKRTPARRFGRHTRIDEHGREVGEPSLRVREREQRRAVPAQAGCLPSPHPPAA